MSVVGHTIDANGLFVKASNGNTILLTPQQIKNHFQTETGTLANRVNNTIDWVLTQIENTLTPDMVSKANITFTFDSTTGKPNGIEVRNL